MMRRNRDDGVDLGCFRYHEMIKFNDISDSYAFYWCDCRRVLLSRV